MIEISARALDQEAFAPFGEVLTVPPDGGRTYFESALKNLRPDAWPSLSIARRAQADTMPYVAKLMERHEFSSQSFIPIDAKRWLVIVAPHAADGGPDAAQLQAFVARGDQGITFAANIWHHPLTVLDEPASFGIMMWRNATGTDEEFVDLAHPVLIR
jgi:ureidoglycolate lyase